MNQRWPEIRTILLWHAAVLLPGLAAGLVFLPPGPTLVVAVALPLFCLPGWPVARLLFGPGRGDRLGVAATVIPAGYLLTSAALVGAGALVGSNPTGTVAAWALVLVGGFLLERRRRARSAEAEGVPPAVGPAFWAATVAVILLGLALMIPPYARVGALTPAGITYRAYFSGDYLKHVAVTAELLRGEVPPANPFFHGGVLHYYWLFYQFPAALAGRIGTDRIEPILMALNLQLAAAFLGLWCVTAHAWLRKRWARVVAVLVPLVGGSFEGLAVLARLRREGRSLTESAGFNVDGYSRWLYGPPEIDTVYRLLLYNMQHILPAALFLVGLLLWRPDRRTPRGAALGMGLLCALAVGHSGFLGSFLTLWGGFCVLTTRSAGGGGLRERLLRSALFSTPPLLALGIYQYGLDMVGSGLPLRLEPALPLLTHPVAFLGLNFGAGVLGLVGLLRRRKGRGPLLLLLLLSMTVVMVLVVPEWPSDTAVKVGYPAALALALLLGSALEAVSRGSRRVLAWTVVTLALVAALPSVVLEVRNFRDLANPRFHAAVDPWDQVAYRWMRENLPPREVIQKGPRADAVPSPYSPIPTFAHHHTYLGDWMHASIFRLPRSLYQERLARVERIFSTRDLGEAHRLCTMSGIDHLYWGHQEHRDYGSPARLIRRPELFQVVYADEGVRLFRVKPVDPSPPAGL